MQLTRKSLSRLGAAGGAAFALPGGVTRASARAGAPPDADLAYLRLLIGAELLALDFQTRALATRKLGPAAPTFRRSLADERAHYATLARLLQDAGQMPATSADVDFTYPRGSFGSRAAVEHLGWRVESLLLGAYLGAIGSVETPELRLPIGQIAANEAQHLSALAPLLGRRAVGRAFPPALAMSAASNRLDAFES
jgi:hypothetical protein